MILRYAASCSLFILVTLFLTESSHAQEAPAPEKKEEEGAMVRIVCVQSLNGKDEAIALAKKPEDGKWIESGELTLSSSLITDWIRVPVGLNNIVRKNGADLTSIGSFTISPTMKRAILILLPDVEKKVYRVQSIDPGKLDFRKGKALIVNYSTIPAFVKMGKQTNTVASGQQVVETITADANGMYPMLIGHLDKDKNTVLCYDHRVSSNPNTRTFILLFSDPDTGLRAMTLSEFGPFE
jgi:hypothetical protein